MIHFQVQKLDINQKRWISEETPIALEDNEVILRVDSFGFTANNITYANLGEAFKYWYFFSPKGEWGSIPCWGFAEVIESNSKDIKVEERYYGYYPMSSYLKVKAANFNGTSFIDSSEHRSKLPMIYNQYFKSGNDVKSLGSEPFNMLFRPLFTTSFLIADYLLDNSFFGTKNIIVTSASSKTALGLGFVLTQMKEQHNLEVNIIGLTSFANVYFVSEVGYFDQVYDYADISQLDKADSIVIDLAGNKDVLSEIDHHLKPHLKHIEAVGLSHSESPKPALKLSCDPKVFFAPEQANKKVKELGIEKFQKELGSYSKSFLKSADKWLQIVSVDTKEAWELIYKHGLNGGFNPESGYIVNFRNIANNY